MNKRAGFTIVEVITVVVVIAALAVIITLSYELAQNNASDNQRRTDMLELKNALTKYYDDNGSYPAVCPVADSSCDSAMYLEAPLVPLYLERIPTPPNSFGNGTYPYISSPAANSTSYAFLVFNESGAQCKTGANVLASWWGGDDVTPRCDF